MPRPAAHAVTPDSTAHTRSGRDCQSNAESGFSTTATGSGRSALRRHSKNSTPAPSPINPNTAVLIAALSSSRKCGNTAANIDHVRRDGHAPPVCAADDGNASNASGLRCTKPVIELRTNATRCSSVATAREAGGAPHPVAIPSNHSSTDGVNSTWQNRFANGASNSYPPAAQSGGFAPAITRVPFGNCTSPTVRSSATANIAACTAGGLVVNSSRNRYPPPPATNSFAHAGASSVTPCSRTTGNPAKSDGSRNDPNTVLHNTPSAAANPRTKLDLPIPGPEINNDGTPARPFASNTVTAVAKSATGILQNRANWSGPLPN